MKILVTGGAGFIGSHLSTSLCAQGHQVHVLDDLSSGFVHNLPAGAVFHQLSILSPEAAAVIEQEKFDVVYHLAAQIDVRKSVSDPGFDASLNIIGSLNLLEASRKAGVKKFIFASSGGAAYGEQDYFPADENHPIRPLSPYGITKVTVERYLYYYRHEYGLEYVALRYGNVYGPRQNPHGEAGVIAIFAKKVLGGEQPMINGDGGQTRDYVFVADVVEANLKALTFAGSGIFNVGTGQETDVTTLFRMVNARYGNRCEEKHGPAKAGEQRRSVLDNQLAKDQLGWTPAYNLETGMRLTLDWFAEHYAHSNTPAASSSTAADSQRL